jgi:acyl dehydratase
MNQDWSVGQNLHPLTRPPFNREQLKQYAKAACDHNPIHLDENFATQAGFPSVIVHGMISMALMADHLQYNFSPNTYTLKKLQARFRKVTFPGDSLICEGKVKSIQGNIMTVSLLTRNQNREITTDGQAEILLKN